MFYASFHVTSTITEKRATTVAITDQMEAINTAIGR